MPDGSRECDLILEKIQEIRDMHITHAATVRAEIAHIKMSLQKIEAIEDAIEKMKLTDARQAGQIDGAVWALAKVGAVVVATFGAVGWLATGGRWEAIKENIFK